MVRAHNPHNGNGEPQQAAVRFIVGMTGVGARVGVVTEAKPLVPHLRRLAPRQGLEVVAETPRRTVPGGPVPKHEDTELLVDRKLARRTASKVRDLTRIVQRYSGVHEPRRNQTALTRGLVRVYMGLYAPPGGPGDRLNGTAWKDQVNQALRWAGRGGCRPVIENINCSTTRLREFLGQYCGPHGDRVRRAVIVGEGVDLGIVVGGRATARTMGYDGSDRPALVYAIVARKRLAPDPTDHQVTDLRPAPGPCWGQGVAALSGGV